ncbi:MAG: hypothetical protein JWM27_1098 [Gemmatimonadetes bacterium]|nr:hypothetical protein [Gemmatimonadota bacterium]
MDPLQSPAQLICPHCGNASKTSDYCSNCSGRIAPRTAAGPVARPAPALPGEEQAAILGLLAMVILAGGLLSALYVWATYGTIASGGIFGQEVSVSNPYAKIAAAAIASNSVIWAALLSGVSRSIQNTIELSRQISRLATKQD